MSAGIMTSESRPVTAACMLDVAEVSFRYGESQAGRAWTLDRITLNVCAGEVLGIAGPNGSGKSSLLKVLAGICLPQHGTVQLQGRQLTALSPGEIARTVAVVPQELRETFPFTVAELVLMGRYPHRRSSWWSVGFDVETDEDAAWTQRAMEEADVAGLAGRLVSDLSGGERQRVMIARALAQNPSVLLLDEPTAFLDLNHQAEICTLISRLARERALTVVLVSHDLNVVSQLCGRLAILKEGRLMHLGAPVDVIRPDVLQAVYGCAVLVDAHPQTGLPRVTMPATGRRMSLPA